MGIWASGVEKNLSVSEIDATVSNYRTTFNGLVENANGNFEAKKYSDALMDMSAEALKTVLKPIKLEALVPGIEVLLRGPIDDAVYGDRIRGANEVLDSSYRTATFFQPKIVDRFENNFSGASNEYQSAICESLGSREASLNVNYCGDRASIVAQIDQRGGSASVAVTLNEMQQRISADIEAGRYSPGQRQADIRQLEEALSEQLSRSNQQTVSALLEVKSAIDISRSNAAARDKKILSGVEENGEKLDQLLANEVRRAEAERRAAERAQEEALEAAETQDIYATGNMIASLIGFIDPETGKKASAIVNTAISINESLDQFSDLAQLGDVGGGRTHREYYKCGFYLDCCISGYPEPGVSHS